MRTYCHLFYSISSKYILIDKNSEMKPDLLSLIYRTIYSFLVRQICSSIFVSMMGTSWTLKNRLFSKNSLNNNLFFSLVFISFGFNLMMRVARH
jgi:hypothetical protein